MDLLKDFRRPDGYAETIDNLESFLFDKAQADDCKCVLVTSGGTCELLEKRRVRFIDNFNNGLRGAVTAECFLRQNFTVIFLHRRGSLCPYARLLPSGPSLLDSFRIRSQSFGKMRVSMKKTANIQTAVRGIRKYKDNLLLIPFLTLDDYLHLLRGVCMALNPLGRRAMVYLAATVSKFHVPQADLPEHLLASRNENLILNLKSVPNVLKDLVTNWASRLFVVTLNPENDVTKMLKRAKGDLKKNGHGAVVGYLSCNPDKVLIVLRRKNKVIELTKDQKPFEIEEFIIDFLNLFHDRYF